MSNHHIIAFIRHYIIWIMINEYFINPLQEDYYELCKLISFLKHIQHSLFIIFINFPIKIKVHSITILKRKSPPRAFRLNKYYN